MIPWTLTGLTYQPDPWSSTKVRISNEARRCVVFLGICDPSGDPRSFEAFGTGFLVYEHGIPADFGTYLVTAKHVVSDGHPFWIRMNTTDGGSQLFLIEEPDWTFHEDETVDLAVMEFVPPSGTLYLPLYELPLRPHRDSMLTVPGTVGPGDITYTVGLFEHHAGQAKNIALVHTGHVAAYPDEPVEVADWDAPEGSGKIKLIEAYVVQCAAMPGSSGSPVFVRTGAIATDFTHIHDKHGSAKPGPMTRTTDKWPVGYGVLSLLGMWQGSWELPQTIFVNRTKVRFPAGYGTVVPGYKIREILKMPKLSERHAARKSAYDEAKKQAKGSHEPDSLKTSKMTKHVFDTTLKKMLETPPDPRVKSK
jgi:hypothetical protein